MRNRWIYLGLTGVTMAMGLLSRKVEGLPCIIDQYSGDTLWALMIFLGIAFLLNKAPTQVVALCAIVFAYGIEVSQLYHTPWIDSIRATTFGGLVLGYGFLWSDLVCYTIGISIGIAIDYIIRGYKQARDL